MQIRRVPQPQTQLAPLEDLPTELLQMILLEGENVQLSRVSRRLAAIEITERMKLELITRIFQQQDLSKQRKNRAHNNLNFLLSTRWCTLDLLCKARQNFFHKAIPKLVEAAQEIHGAPSFQYEGSKVQSLVENHFSRFSDTTEHRKRYSGRRLWKDVEAAGGNTKQEAWLLINVWPYEHCDVRIRSIRYNEAGEELRKVKIYGDVSFAPHIRHPYFDPSLFQGPWTQGRGDNLEFLIHNFRGRSSADKWARPLIQAVDEGIQTAIKQACIPALKTFGLFRGVCPDAGLVRDSDNPEQAWVGLKMTKGGDKYGVHRTFQLIHLTTVLDEMVCRPSLCFGLFQVLMRSFCHQTLRQSSMSQVERGRANEIEGLWIDAMRHWAFSRYPADSQTVRLVTALKEVRSRQHVIRFLRTFTFLQDQE